MIYLNTYQIQSRKSDIYTCILDKYKDFVGVYNVYTGYDSMKIFEKDYQKFNHEKLLDQHKYLIKLHSTIQKDKFEKLYFGDKGIVHVSNRISSLNKFKSLVMELLK